MTADPFTAAPLHPNHLPDLRYVLKVLQGLHVQQHQKNEVAAAIVGMEYIVRRTEEAQAAAEHARGVTVIGLTDEKILWHGTDHATHPGDPSPHEDRRTRPYLFANGNDLIAFVRALGVGGNDGR